MALPPPVRRTPWGRSSAPAVTSTSPAAPTGRGKTDPPPTSAPPVVLPPKQGKRRRRLNNNSQDARTVVVTVRITPADYNLIEGAVGLSRMSRAAWIIRAAIRQAERELAADHKSASPKE